MDEEAGFLSAIRQTPADDTTRLVYADWLDEQGDPASTAKAEFIRLELAMAQTPEEGLNRVRWVNKLQKLATNMTPGWLAVVSHPKFEACRVSFQFECPKRWDQLTPTDAKKLRFCTVCAKHVHYCESIDEARDHAARGECVAVSLALVRRPDDLTMPRPILPGRLFRLAPEEIERLGGLRRIGADPPAEPGPPPSPVRPQWVPDGEPRSRGRVRRNRRAKMRKRNIQRENWEDQE